MKRPSLLTISLIVNGLLLVVLAVREEHHIILRWFTEGAAAKWATYAGSMQARADFGNGVRRFYRPTLARSDSEWAGFTGQLDHGAEVWSWPYHAELGESWRMSDEAFTEAYNKRMMGFINDPASYARNGACAAARRPASTRAAATQAQSWTGVAESDKAFTYIQTASGRIYVEMPDHSNRWPDTVAGKNVCVTGKLVERHDLPVFIPKPGGPVLQGIPMSAGTDLYEASARQVIENAQWSLANNGER